MKRHQQSIEAKDSIPQDVALNIMSFLEAPEVCSLGGCSKFWRESSGCDFIWKNLYKLRWAGSEEETDKPYFEGWRRLYAKKHKEMGEKAACLEKRLFCPEIEVNIYQKTLNDMKLMQFGIKDVQMFFLKPNANVIFNLLALHYCLNELQLQVDTIVQLLRSYGVYDRKVYIQWWQLGNLMHRGRAPNVLHARRIPLYDLASAEGVRILRLLEQGIMGDVLKIHLCPKEPHADKFIPPRDCPLCKGLRREVATLSLCGNGS